MLRDEYVVLTITDDGIPFNPLTAAPPDLSLLLHEREIGGLGIHLVRSLFDEVLYHRNVGRNVLTVKKKLVSELTRPGSPAKRPRISTDEVRKRSPAFSVTPIGEGRHVACSRRGAVVIVTPRDRFDTNSAPEVERMLLDLIEGGERRIVLDLSHISYISSIGLRVILKVGMIMTETGGRLVLSGGNEHICTVLQLSGALMITLHVPTLDEACSQIQ